jgi:hypothetical protein
VGTKGDTDAVSMAAIGVLAALSAVPATIGVTAQPGLLRALAFGLTGVLWLWSAVLVWPHLRPKWLTRPGWLRWPGKKELARRWPLRPYLDRRYGKLVPFAAEQRIINGYSHWFWVCPHCELGNEGGDRCGECAAVFDGARFRVKKARREPQPRAL